MQAEVWHGAICLSRSAGNHFHVRQRRVRRRAPFTLEIGDHVLLFRRVERAVKHEQFCHVHRKTERCRNISSDDQSAQPERLRVCVCERAAARDAVCDARGTCELLETEDVRLHTPDVVESVFTSAFPPLPMGEGCNPTCHEPLRTWARVMPPAVLPSKRKPLLVEVNRQKTISVRLEVSEPKLADVPHTASAPSQRTTFFTPPGVMTESPVGVPLMRSSVRKLGFAPLVA